MSTTQVLWIQQSSNACLCIELPSIDIHFAFGNKQQHLLIRNHICRFSSQLYGAVFLQFEFSSLRLVSNPADQCVGNVAAGGSRSTWNSIDIDISHRVEYCLCFFKHNNCPSHAGDASSLNELSFNTKLSSSLGCLWLQCWSLSQSLNFLCKDYFWCVWKFLLCFPCCISRFSLFVGFLSLFLSIDVVL